MVSGWHTRILERLAELLPRGQERAKDSGRPVLVSVTQAMPEERDPLEFFASAEGDKACRVFWARPAQQFWLAGIGSAASVAASGMAPFAKAKQEYRSILSRAIIEGSAIRGVGPIFMGGFRFDCQARQNHVWRDFPDGLLILPRLLFAALAGEQWLTINIIIRPVTDPSGEIQKITKELNSLMSAKPLGPSRQSGISSQVATSHEEWTGRVQHALQAIQEGRLGKVVLARTMRLHSKQEFSLGMVLAGLCASYPECSIFALDNGSSAFVAAAPEVLMRLDKGMLHLSCLAGTTGRGSTPEEDDLLAQGLLRSEKDQREHAMVVKDVAKALEGHCDRLAWNKTPQVVRLPTLQHLATFFDGSPKAPTDILDLVKLLHPTPAVGGLPSESALEIIRHLEGDRGWYAAPVGWVDQHGEGEFNVAIRSAVIRGREATLFAGAGIVEGSDPNLELKETELKFQPLLRALGTRNNAV